MGNKTHDLDNQSEYDTMNRGTIAWIQEGKGSMTQTAWIKLQNKRHENLNPKTNPNPTLHAYITGDGAFYKYVLGCVKYFILL